MVVTECGGVHGYELSSAMCCRWCTRWSVSNVLEVFTVPGIGSVCVDRSFGSFHCPGDGVSLC